MRAHLLIRLMIIPVAAGFSQQAPDDQQALNGFEALIKAGNYHDAAQQLEPYVASHPNSWRALYQSGYVHFRLQHIGQSLTMVSRSLAIHEPFAEAHKILAYDLNILGRKDLAITELARAIQLDPASWESEYELGRICYEKGSYLEAVRAFEKVKQLAPEYVKTYHNLGLAYAGTGDRAKAIENFEQGLRLNEKQPARSAWPLIDYAAFLNLQSEYEKARALLLQAIEINPSWGQEYEELSKAYRGLGKTNQAIQSLKRAVAIDPQKAENHYVLARLYGQTHEPEEAKQELAEYERVRAKADKPK